MKTGVSQGTCGKLTKPQILSVPYLSFQQCVGCLYGSQGLQGITHTLGWFVHTDKDGAQGLASSLIQQGFVTAWMLFHSFRLSCQQKEFWGLNSVLYWKEGGKRESPPPKKKCGVGGGRLYQPHMTQATTTYLFFYMTKCQKVYLQRVTWFCWE